MTGDRCTRPGCPGMVDERYCNVCGLAEARAAAGPGSRAADVAASRWSGVQQGSSRSAASVGSGLSGRSSAAAATGSSPVSRATGSSRRRTHGSARTSRKQLGAGLITLPDLPPTDPERALLTDPHVPERKRFCAICGAPLKRESGFCGKCGAKYSFVPGLVAGDVVAGQYLVKGPIAFGGLGWIYLGFDRLLSRYVVLKGLLNTADASAAAAAVAERQFLASVKHPNIVGIYNFVQSGSDGFIVMEYVGGQTLKQIRQERGPLPVAEAIAYIHRILPAFGYLHRLGLVYCDFKPDNVMLEHDDVKLIDLGGVRRVDDPAGDIYGTVGYSAPEAGEGPTPSSDLYTLGRTLAVLLTDIRGFGKEHRYTLPGPSEEPRFAEGESLYRFLLKATAEKADDRFESADEMAEQLLGVLRETVARDTGVPRPGSSLLFGPDPLALDTAAGERNAIRASGSQLPMFLLDLEDPGAQAVSAAEALAEPARKVAALRLAAGQAPKSREARLRLAAALGQPGELGNAREADALLAALTEEDLWDWRVLWVRARLKLATGKPPDAAEARKLFDQVYFDLPGELAPKLALGLAAEMAGERSLAAKMYELVARTDGGMVSAVFGLARCRFAAGDRRGAVAALDLIPSSSALYLRARVEAAQTLVRVQTANDHAALAPEADDLAAASAVAEGLALEGAAKFRLAREIFEAALDGVGKRKLAPSSTTRILGQSLEERSLRLGLESSLRSMARLSDVAERIRLVDEANAVRPRTLV